MYSVQLIFLRFRQPKNWYVSYTDVGNDNRYHHFRISWRTYLPQFSLKLIHWSFYASAYIFAGCTARRANTVMALCVDWMVSVMARLCSPLNRWITKSSLIILSTHVYIIRCMVVSMPSISIYISSSFYFDFSFFIL